MNWRLIAFEMGLFWNDPLRSKNARRANVLWTNARRANVLWTNAEGECPKGECPMDECTSCECFANVCDDFIYEVTTIIFGGQYCGSIDN
jgi:hypothetical protein